MCSVVVFYEGFTVMLGGFTVLDRCLAVFRRGLGVFSKRFRSGFKSFYLFEQ